MAGIRPNQLPPADNVSESAAIIVDSGGPIQKATPIQIVDTATPLASKSEAEFGTNNSKRMTPLRVKQSIDANAVSIDVLASPDPGKGADLSVFKRPGVGTVSRTVRERLLEAISITDFGAKFDVSTVTNIADATDDSDAWEAALAYLQSIGGGTLHLPDGASKVTRQIQIPHNVRIVGTGVRKVYPGVFAVGVDCPSTVVPVHNNLAAFYFQGATGSAGFVAENWNVATLETGDYPTHCFVWETGSGFQRNFNFNLIGIHGFRKSNDSSAFAVVKTSGDEPAVGKVVIRDCVINRNNWIANTFNGTNFNLFHFTDNEAGQNGYLPGTGGVRIRAHDAAIIHNSLEAMRDAVVLSGGFYDIVVQGNYFEANVGPACIRIADARNPRVGPNNYGMGQNYAASGQDPDTFVGPVVEGGPALGRLGQKVLLSYTGSGDCVDPYWSQGVSKTRLPALGNGPVYNLNSGSDLQFARADRFDGEVYSQLPLSSSVSQQGVTNVVRDINPQTGNPMPAQQHTTSGTGALSASTGVLSGAAGNWLVVSWLMRRMSPDGDGLDPWINLNINSSGQIQDFPFFNFRHAWRIGEWALLTVGVRLKVNISALTYNLYPYGISPTAGLVANCLRPYMYVTDDPNKILPFVNNRWAESVTAAPTTGTWETGDTLLNRVTGGFWKCTAGGAPGTWEAI